MGDTVEALGRSSSRGKVAALLRKVNIDPAKVLHFNDLFPETETVQLAKHSHNTNADESVLEYYGKIDGVDIRNLRDHYNADYTLFGMATPDWAEAMIEN